MIVISIDRENKTLTFEDSGVGMTRSDQVYRLGAISKSRTKSFQKTTNATMGGHMWGYRKGLLQKVFFWKAALLKNDSL